MFFLTPLRERYPLHHRTVVSPLWHLSLTLLLLLLTLSVCVVITAESQTTGIIEKEENIKETTTPSTTSSIIKETTTTTTTTTDIYNTVASSLLPSENLSTLNAQLRATDSYTHLHLTPAVWPDRINSSCTIEHGCPRSSMVWATGTFTNPEVLTPASFLIAANLTLKMSLCCGYKFDGKLLREEKLYDAFLHILLQATPFQVLTVKEKRDMFPRERVIIANTIHQRYYNSSYVLTEKDKHEQNDGDGDVIMLISGAVGKGIQRVLFPQQQQQQQHHNNNNQYGVKGSESNVDDVPAEIQLKVANLAIKCKCPHTLLVMPILRVRPDTLPPISIVGLGSHCGTQYQHQLEGTERITNNHNNSNNNSNSNTDKNSNIKHKNQQPQHPHIVQLRDNSWAVSFAVSVPLPAATAVHWIVTDTTNTNTKHTTSSTTTSSSSSSSNSNINSNSIVLDEFFHISSSTNDASKPLLPLHYANSSYFTIQPHHAYTVQLTLTRGTVKQTASGTFIMRLPLERNWDVRRQSPQVHFGVKRQMRLSQETRAFHTVRRELAPPLLQDSHNRYYGYWENTPLEDQPQPQTLRRVRDNNPYTAEYKQQEEENENKEKKEKEEETVIYSLFVGRNDISFYVVDVDEVCAPTLLETHEVWSLQALLLQPSTSPTTACNDDISLEALALKRLLATMQELRQLAVQFAPFTLWESEQRRQIEKQQEKEKGGKYKNDIMEGYFNCTERGVGMCQIRSIMENRGGTSAVLEMRRRGVAELSWIVRVVVQTSTPILRENIDPTHARIVVVPPTEVKEQQQETEKEEKEDKTNTTGVVVVELHSHAVLVVRRMSTMPTHVTVSLPMQLRQLTVHPPRPLEDTRTSDNNNNNNINAIDRVETPPLGRWQVAAPLRIISIDESLVLILDTQDVPNVEQTLPTGTLRYIAEDYGAAVDDIGTPYTSRCPSRIVEHTVKVFARPAPPIIPALVPVYTEKSCVRLQAPRVAWKDESIEWHFPPCAESTQLPYLVKQAQKPQEGKKEEGGEEVFSSQEEEVMVCGVEVHKWCNVEWIARNLLGAVTQTFSLRRCQRPPQLLFHKETPQSMISSSSSSIPLTVYTLPYIEWLEEEKEKMMMDNTNEETSLTSEDGVRRYYTARPVLPIAGYNASIVYSFNYTGLQEDFEAYFTYAHDAAHQLGNTQQHYEPVRGSMNIDNNNNKRNDATDAVTTPLLLRRFVPLSEEEKESISYNLKKDSNRNNNDVETTGLEYGEDDDNNNNNNLYFEQSMMDGTTRRDYVIDMEYDARFSLTQRATMRQIELHGISNSSLYPLLYAVGLSPNSHAPRRDAAEFNRRGMCTARTGNISVLAINPRGVVQVREGDVIPFCQSSFIFSRHPWLNTKYHFDFSWSCGSEFSSTTTSSSSGGSITVEKRTPTLSILHHNGGSDSDSISNETYCSLTVHNTLTDTTQTDTFLLRRVYPTPPSSAFVLLSDNTATGSCITNTTAHARDASTKSANGISIPSSNGNHNNNNNGSGKTKRSMRWVVGKSVVLHVDAPMRRRTSKWRVISVIPAVPTSMGTQIVMDSVQFLPLVQHPRAIARGTGGATVLVTGIRVPGLYTFAHYHPDPIYPNVCPNVSFVETLHVTHAQVIEKELTVCGDTAVLKAVPIPREISCNFIGQWELVSVQRSTNETWTSGANFTGVRFDHGTKPRTQVRGLPFGIVTIRWAIYAISPLDQRNDTSHQQQQQQQQQHQGQQRQKQHRVLVDYDTVRLFVLTDNLRSHRLVTLSSTVDIPTTTSTQRWTLVETPGTTSPLTLRRPRFHIEVVSNSSDRNSMGFEVLIVENLPIGVTRLQYELHPSLYVFGPMRMKSCPFIRRQQVEIERVSAFLSVNATLDHECDAYTGRGHFSICLHAERVRGSTTTTTTQTSSTTTTTTGKEENEKKKQRSERDEDVSPFGVRLVHPTAFEEIVKSGAARLARRGCSLPWWMTAKWENVHRVDAAGRCLSFRVIARRHLRPFELTRPLFRAVSGGDIGRNDCLDGSDVITSEVIAGAPTSGSSSSGVHTGRQGNGRGEAETAEGNNNNNHHNHNNNNHNNNNGIDVRMEIRERERNNGVAAFLPFLNPVTLTRMTGTMRPMLSLRGDPDVVVSELDISDTGAAVVVLRLDTAQPLQMGGYTYSTPYSMKQKEKRNNNKDKENNVISIQEEEEEGEEEDQQTRQTQQQQRRYSLLSKCVRGTLQGSDVLQFWSEVNRPDGLDDQTAKEWLEYVEKVRDANVKCEPLFASLDHLLPRHDDTEAALQSRRAQRVPPKEQRLVSLEVILQQLEGLQQEFRWTRDGIDVTGLRADLQAALSRRRITKSQLEEIARLRREHEEQKHHKEKQQQQQHQQPQLIVDSPKKGSREEQFERALRLYKGVLNEDIAAVRLTLPRHKSFTVPHNLFLRTAIHKDVLCGTNISGTAGIAVMPILAPPESLVLFGRIEIVDVPPAVSATPGAIKQCEVEGGVPLIQVNVSGTRFAHLEPFPTDRIILEELRNPNWTDTLDSPPDVGLAPCLQQMHAGMKVSTSSITQKQLYLQLAPCPSFQMLSPADYNENQNSELLQRKLQLSRLLRVTLREVLSEDSHTKGKTSVSFVVEVRPTLARLHLRVLPGIEEISRGLPWLEFENHRPLLICESDIRRKGMELGIELIGDEWNNRVGEETEESEIIGGESENDDSSSSLMSEAWNRDGINTGAGHITLHRRREKRIRRRSPHNVALVNSFSVVEHHSLDSAHHLFLRHGGVYRSHFVNYLFSTVLADPENIRQYQFIHRYNKTFVSVRIPAESRDPDDLRNDNHYENSLLNSDYIPPIRPFSTIEEILFAVPGIATECRGCLLADTTYFVAGDLTGLWSFPPSNLPVIDNSLLAAPLRVPFYAAGRVPREWRFTMICPTAAWENLQRLWQSSSHVLNSERRIRKGKQQQQQHQHQQEEKEKDELHLELELVVYSLRDMLGGEVPLSKRPTILLTSAPLSVAKLLRSSHTSHKKGKNPLSEIVFHVNTSAAERAHAMMAADFVRYGRRHLHTVYDYVRDESGSGGSLAVNASVFLKVCIPPTIAVPESQCSIVSFTHSLLVMEEPRMGVSYYAQLRRGSWGSMLYPPLLMHHVGTALLGYFIFPRLATLRRMLINNRQDVKTARNGITVMLFVAVMFLYPMAPRLWGLTCILLWATLLRLVPRVIVVMYFLLHFLIWAVVL